jgi:hypothetical protein
VGERIECGDDTRVRRRKPQRVSGVREHRVILRWRPSSRPAFACSRKRCARGTQLGEIARVNPKVAIGSYPFFDPQHGANTNEVLRARDPQKLALAKHVVEDVLEPVRRAQSNSACALSRRKQGFESPRERQ